MSWARRAAVGMAMAAVVAGLAGCGSSPSEVDAGDATTVPGGGDPAVESATASPVVAPGAPTFGPGTPLGSGVEVVDGSALVGAVVPLIGWNVPVEDQAADLGWEALLVVDGDPFEVWDAYAAALGLADVASARQACVVERASGASADQRFITEAPIDGEQRLRCWVQADGASMHLVVGAVDCSSGADQCSLPAAHLLISRSSPVTVEGEGYTTVGTDNLRFDRAVAELPEPEPAPDAGKGEPATADPEAAPTGEPVVPASTSGALTAGATVVAASTRGDAAAATVDEGLRLASTSDAQRSLTLASTGSLAGPAGRAEEDLPEPVAIPEGPIQPLELDTTPDPVFPGPGEPMDLGLDYFLGGATAAILPDDVRSLVVPTTAIRCNSGLVTALDAPGSPVDVVQSFDPGMLDELQPPATGAIDGVEWATFTYDEAGGMKLTLSAIDVGSGRSFVLVTECGD